MVNDVTLPRRENEDDFAKSHIPGSIFIGLQGGLLMGG